MATKKETVAVKATKKAAPKAAEVKISVAKPKAGSLSVPVLSLSGGAGGDLSLPKEIFGVEVNKSLLAQAMRVYTTNQTAHWAHTKTRGEIAMTTAKIYRQKGTGNARHGAKSAPIFVKGGVALGPKYRKTVLELPKKMRKAALISALSQKILNGEILALADLEKASGKTKQMASLAKGLREMAEVKKRSILIVNDQKIEAASRAVHNLPGMNFLTVDQLNAFEVIRHQSLLLTKAAVERLQKGKEAAMSEEVSEKNEEVKASTQVKTTKPTAKTARKVAKK